MKTIPIAIALASVVVACCAGSPASPAATEPAPGLAPETHGDDDGHHQGHMTHDFSDAARWAKVFDDPSRDEWQKPDHVVALMEIQPGMTVVDLGAGTGYFLSYFSRAVGPGGLVLGLDIEQTLVDHMTGRAAAMGLKNVTAKKIGTDDPGIENESADRIVIVDTWHHIADRVQYTRRLAQALKPGGAVYVVDFDVTSHRGPPARHKLEPQVVVEELTAGGLICEILKEDLPDQYVVVGRLPATQIRREWLDAGIGVKDGPKAGSARKQGRPLNGHRGRHGHGGRGGDFACPSGPFASTSVHQSTSIGHFAPWAGRLPLFVSP